ncbi:MAG: VanZ family protein [Gammaproteobacteria bacterium]|jgi:VanZ family protein
MLIRRLALLMALAWMALLFFLSHQSGLHTPSLFSAQDKVAHALVYGVLGALLLASQAPHTHGYGWRQMAASILVASMYGITDELHQSFVPGRNVDLWDWVADTLGALLAVLLVAWLVRRHRELKAAASKSSL